MRVEPYGVGSYIHVLKRGVRKMPIVRDVSDKRRFLTLLRYLNTVESHTEWYREITTECVQNNFEWPSSWRPQKPLVKILAFTLMPNHFHLLLKETREGGVSEFMRKVANSMNGHFNKKYHEAGSMFQGSYKSRTIKNDDYLRYVSSYIMVKNPFELFPGGYRKAEKNFEDAYSFATKYPFCSLANYTDTHSSPIIDKDILGEIFSSSKQFKDFSKDVILGRSHLAAPESILLE